MDEYTSRERDRRVEESFESVLESFEKARKNEPYVHSRCIALSENAVSFDVEMHWRLDFDIGMRRHSYSIVKVNVVVTKSLKISLSYPYDQARPILEKEKLLIEHCIERAKVILQIEGT